MKGAASLVAVVALLFSSTCQGTELPRGPPRAAAEIEEPNAEPLQLTDYHFICTVTSKDDSGAGTLRDCITQANMNGGNILIDFGLRMRGATINLLSELPQMADPLSSVAIRGSVSNKGRRNPTVAGAASISAGLYFSENVSVRLVNLNVVGFGTGVVMRGTGPPGPPSTVTCSMHGISVTGAASTGADIVDVEQGIFTQSQFNGAGGSGVVIRYETIASGSSVDFAVRDSIFDSNGFDGLDADWGRRDSPVAGITGNMELTRSFFRDNKGFGCFLSDATALVNANAFSRNRQTGAAFLACSIPLIKDSFFVDNGSDGIGDGLDMRATTVGKITNSAADGNGGDGIQMSGCTVGKMTHVSASGNTGGSGLDIFENFDSDSVIKLMANTILSNNRDYGYELTGATIKRIVKGAATGNGLGAAGNAEGFDGNKAAENNSHFKSSAATFGAVPERRSAGARP